MNTIIEATSKQDAINQCSRFLQYFPYRFAAITETDGKYGWCNGKTRARMNTLAKKGINVFMITKSKSWS